MRRALHDRGIRRQDHTGQADVFFLRRPDDMVMLRKRVRRGKVDRDRISIWQIKIMRAAKQAAKIRFKP